MYACESDTLHQVGVFLLQAGCGAQRVGARE